MGDSLDMAVPHGVVVQEDQAAVDTTVVHHVAAPDDISQADVSKEVGQALSYSATAEEMKSNVAHIVVTTVTPAPSGAQDSHILKPVPQIKFKERRSSEQDDPPEWKDKGSTSGSGAVAIATATAGPSGSGAKDVDPPDLDKFEFPVEPAPLSIPKPRKPILKALMLPEEHPSPQPSPRGSAHGSQRGTPMGPMPTYFAAGPITSKKPPKALTRLKTRLQDPPPMTPAVSEMIGRRQYTGGLFNEQGMYEQGMMTSRVVAAGRKQSVVVGNLSRVASFAAATPGKLRSMASKIFTPRGTPNTPAPVPEIEEIDPLDDDSIPKYKKWKRTRNKWLHIMQWVSLIIVCTLLTCSVRIKRLRNVYWLQIVLWQWVTLALVVLCGRLISGWAVKLLVLLIERHYLLKRRVLYFVYGLRHSVKNCIWLALVIGTWKVILRNETDKSTIPVITKILWCFFTASLLWMSKVLFVKTAANSFHRAAYFDRIQDCLFHQYVLETISQPKTVDNDDYWGMGVRLAGVEENKEQYSSLEGSDESTHPAHDFHRTNSAEFHGTQSPRTPSILDSQDQPIARLIGSENVQGQEHAINIGGSLAPHVPLVVQRAIDPGQFSTVYETQPYMSTPSRGSPHYSPATGLQTSRGKVTYVGLPNPNDGKDPEPAAVVIAQDKLQELTSDTVSAWTLKRLMKLVRTSNMSTFSSMLSADWEIDSEAQAKSAAKQIFYNMADSGTKFLTLKNFMEFLPEDKAAKAFALFEVSDQGQISKKALMKWVVSVYKERKALSLTLSDNRTVVAKLHRVLDVLMLAILLTICFLIMGVNTQKLLVAFSSILLPSVFVFGNAARSTFESLIFLFIMHPFDVGDRILVDNVSLVVEEMNILNTIFLSGSNEKVYYPNSVLASKPISNFYRSPDQWDAIDFQIHATTPVEKIGLLKEKMTKYIEGLPQYWYPTFRLVCKDIEDSNRMKMAIWMQHHMNYQEAGERWQRRSNLILHMKTIMEELEIVFRLPRQEITVTGIPLLDVPHTQL